MKIDIYNTDDWTAIYLDGEKVAEDHSISFKRFLDLMGVKHTSYSCEPTSEAEDDEDVWFVPDNTEQLKEHFEKHPDWITKYEEGAIGKTIELELKVT